MGHLVQGVVVGVLPYLGEVEEVVGHCLEEVGVGEHQRQEVEGALQGHLAQEVVEVPLEYQVLVGGGALLEHQELVGEVHPFQAK